jgi:ATP-dependent helicase/nuclease subunit A
VPTDTRLTHDDDAARGAALDVSRSFIVQAPAGSGKTELLIQRYLKLLAVVEAPEEVLAITFTRKAAAEMELRVLEALRAATQGRTATEPHLRVTAQAAEAALRRDRDRGWDIIANPRRLRIQTLDSLNGMIARAQPMTSAGAAAGNAILTDAELASAYRRAAALTLDQLTERGELRDATEQVLLHLDNNTGLYIDYLARMLATRDQWLPFVGSGLVDAAQAAHLRRRFESSLAGAVNAQLARLRSEMQASAREVTALACYAAAQLLEAGKPDNPVCACAELRELPADDAHGLIAWRGIAELLLTAGGEWRRRVTRAQGFPTGDAGEKESLMTLIASLQEHDALRRRLDGTRGLPQPSYGEAQWQVLLALFRLLPLAVSELQRLFAERGMTDHTEVALSASRALGTAEEPGDVALLLDYQLRHLLVDEMQDTSSAQYRMLEALTGGWTDGDGRTLFCVGDPMQSIYRFRNAEVGQFLLARQAGIGTVVLTPLTLRRNFRSGEQLVDWFNTVFSHVLPPDDDPSRSAVSYSPAVSVPALAGAGECVVHPLFGSGRSAEAREGSRIVREILDGHPDDDVAVLVRSRSHLPELLARLREEGIAYRAVEIDRLTDLPEIIDVLALTRALVHPGDRLAWLALLRAPWLGLDWTDLHALVRNDTRETVRDLMHDDARLSGLSRDGRERLVAFRDLLAKVAAGGRVETLRERVERTWLTLGGPAAMGSEYAVRNVYRFLDVIGSIETAGLLPDVAELEARLDREYVSTDAPARLQVMTMHRAKGLQFDHVLLYGLGRVPRHRDAQVLNWFDIPDEHGDARKVISPVAPRAELEKDPIHSYIGKVEAEKDANELGRLLYVACTRAKKSLHLAGHVRISKTGIGPDPRSLLQLLWPELTDRFERDFDPDSRVADEARENWLIPRLHRLAMAWRLPAPAAVPGIRGSEGAAGADRAVDYDWVGVGARVAGTVVHRWLQLAAGGGIELPVDEPAHARAVSERWLRELGVASGAQEPVLRRVLESLRGIATDETGRWLMTGEGHAELALCGVVEGRVESIVIDRVCIDGDGTHWIVDYKTSSHEGGSLPDFLASETERYRPQLRRYAEIYRNYAGVDVRCALYFPLLQQFVEVDL